MSDDKKSKACIVPVWTSRLGLGPPMIVNYIAGYSDPTDAKEAVQKHIGSGEGDVIKEPSQISDATADSLGVRSGDVWML